MAKFKNQCSSGSKASRYILLLNVTTGTQNISGNYTPVSYTLQLAGGNYDGDNYNQYASSFHGYTCYGTVQVRNANTGALLHESGSSSNGMVSNTSAITIASGSFNAPHNPDGTLLLGFTGSFSGGLSSQASGGSIAGDLPLATIPRNNEITGITNNYIEDIATITLTRNGNLTTTITYVLNGQTFNVVDKTPYTSAQFQIPSGFYNNLASNSKETTITLNAITYSGDLQIGSPKSKTFPIYAREEKVEPIVDFIAYDGDVSTTAITQDEYKVIKGLSDIYCTNISVQPRYGATITSVNINGTNIPYSEIDEEFVHIIPNTTTNVFTLTATDSRGFSAEKLITLEDTGYTKPTISGTAERNNPTDGLVDISFDGSNFVKKIVNTDNELMVQYRKYQKGATNKGNWTNLTYTLNDNGTFTGKLDNVSGFDYQKEYVVELKCYDLLSESNIVTISITKGEPVFWWNSDNFYFNSGIYQKKDDAYKSIFDLIYPVGSIYMSINPTNPSLLFGGEWQQIKGRFLLGTGTPDANSDNYFGAMSGWEWNAGAGSTGGQDYHRLTVDEMPSHRHEGIKWFGEQNISLNSTGGYGGYGLTGWSQQIPESYSPLYTAYTGSGAVHNNMPPYFAVYIWQRVG